MQPTGNENETDTSAIFNLDLKDEDLVTLLRSSISGSKSFWEGNRRGNRKLKTRRERNIRYWQGDHYNDITLYDHEMEYTDNRIYVDVETTIPLVTANIATPQCLPSNPDKLSSVEVAKDIERVLYRLAEINNLDKKMEIATRDNLLQYVGVLKVRFDPDHGKDGEIVVDVVDPSKLTIDHNVDLFGEPRFIAEELWWDLVEIIRKFPDQKALILKKLNVSEAQIPFHTQKYQVNEVHFSYYDKDDNYKPKEGVAWFMENNSFVLGKMETPNWLPENKANVKRNFFDRPTKPYIFVNYINSGRKKVDDNAPIDQAIKQQDIVNRRGRQIIENAENIQGGIVYNTEMISTDDMAKLVGAPDEKVGVTGDVNKAFARVAPPVLPSYVENQLLDSRYQIDEYFATHNVTRGQGGGNDTLGQDVLQRNQDFTRHDKLVSAVEDATLGVYKMWVQFMKVYYDHDHYMAVSGEQGQFDKVIMRDDRIEDGIDITVQKGSTAPTNKEQNRQDAIALADRGLIDPFTAIEVLQTGVMPSPQKVMQRLMQWLADKGSYLNEVKQDEMDRQAAVDIAILNRGVMPPARSEPTSEYLEARNKYLASGEFFELPEKIQQLHIKNLQLNKVNAQRMLSLKEALTNTTAQTMAASVQAAKDATVDPTLPPPTDPAAAPSVDLSAVQPGMQVNPATAGAGGMVSPGDIMAPETAVAPEQNPTSQQPLVIPQEILPR